MPRLAALFALIIAVPGLAQSVANPPAEAAAFDVTSVRPSAPGSVGHSNVPLDTGNVYGTISADDARTASGGLLIAVHQPLWRLISFAYSLSGTQELALRFNMFSGAPRSGAPAWVTGTFDSPAEFFDISARAPAGTTRDQMRLMMRSLLADRFQMVAHIVTADAPVMALTLVHPGETGPHLRPHPPSDTCVSSGGAQSPSTDPALPALCGIIGHVASQEPGLHYGGRAVPMALLATSIPTMTGLAANPHPIVDQTGLPGLYDFTLSWVHDSSAGPTPSTASESTVSDNTAAFREALRSQLGLTLKPAHAPIAFLVIDHVAHPSAN